MTDWQENGSRVLCRWFLATTIGWIVGFFALIVFVESAERLGLNGAVGVGLGISLSTGLFQWLVARKWFGASRQWIWATAVGMTIPFAFIDLLEVFGISVPEGALTIDLCVVCGGLLAGVWQARLLKSRVSGSHLWILFSLAAWILAALTTLGIMKPGHPETFLDMVQNLGAIPIGGLVQGFVSGGSLLWLLRREVKPA